MAGADAVVVGAGVIGLTSAICLAEAGLAVVCRTAEPSARSTSSVAGALWAGSPDEAPDERLTAWTRASLDEFRALAGGSQTGVRIAPGVVASHRSPEPPPAHMFPGVEVRRRAVAPEGYRGAFEVHAPLIDMPVYLDYLQRRLEAAGGQILVRRVDALDDLVGEAPVIVNCPGLGARELVRDTDVEPVWGQHVVVENPGLEEFFIDDRADAEWTCWFPHPSRVVLGGITRPGVSDLRPDPAVAQRIIERCAALEPRLRDARVIDHQVGLRPVRGSVRLEREALAGATCVHNYGHGRSGVSLSWGCAREAQRLLTGEP